MTKLRLGVVLALAACSAGKPTRYHYTLYLKDVPPLGQVFAGDRLLGQAYPRFSTDAVLSPTVGFELSPDELLTRLGALSVRFETPCGPSTPVPLALALTEAEEVERRESSREFAQRAGGVPDLSADVAVTSPPRWPTMITLWVDHGAGEVRLQVGSAELPPRKGEGVSLFDLGCAPTHEVRLEGKVIGQLPLGDPKAEHYLIASEPGACYRSSQICYGPEGATGLGSSSQVLAGAQLFELRDRPTYFLKEAPGSVQGLQQCVEELVRAPCTDGR